MGEDEGYFGVVGRRGIEVGKPKEELEEPVAPETPTIPTTPPVIPATARPTATPTRESRMFNLLEQTLDKLDLLREDIKNLKPPKGVRFNTGIKSITTATIANVMSPPPRANYPVWLNIYDKLHGRTADIIVHNMGRGNLFALSTSDGQSWSAEEIKINRFEHWIFTDAYSIAIRTDAENTKYYATEISMLPTVVHSSVSQADNLRIPISNPSFETGEIDMYWSYSGDGSVEIDDTIVNVGSYSARINVNAGGYVDLWNNEILPTRARRTIQTSAYIRGDSNVDKVYLLVRYLSSDEHLLTDNVAVDRIDKSFTPTTSFARYIRETTTPPGAAYYQVGVRVYADVANDAQCWIDDFALPAYPPAVPQFYYQVTDLFPQYIPPNTTIPLHVSDYGEVGKLTALEVELNYKECYITIETDTESQVFAIKALIEAGLTNPQPASIWISEIDDVNHRYSINMTPGGSNIFAYNYRIALYITNPQHIRNDAPEETLGVGAPPQVTFTGNLANVPVWAKSLTITDGVEVFTDNGDGTLTGSAGGTGTINYSTGAYSVTFNTAPALNVNIVATYWYATPNTTTAKIYKGKIVDRVFA